MRIAFAAARSSPGVTTTALAFASVMGVRVLLVEASEDGGSLAVRYGLTLEPGLTTLAAATRHEVSSATISEHAQDLPGTESRLQALVGPPTPEAAQLLMRNAGDRLADVLTRVDDQVVLIDAGRLPAAPSTVPLLTSVDAVVLVARPRAEELATIAYRLPALRDLGLELRLVLVGDAPYGPEAVAAEIDLPVIGALADDRQTADAMAGIGSTRRLTRSPLLRSAATLLDHLTDTGEVKPRPASAPTAPTASLTEQAVWTGKGGAR